MRVLVWLLRAALFFVLFAFALNNNDPVSVKGFFGYEWRAPLVFVVLAAFALGGVFGVLAMVPSWWRHRRVARRQQRAAVTTVPPADAVALPAGGVPAPIDLMPPRDGF